jgi:hypothetical protein
MAKKTSKAKLDPSQQLLELFSSSVGKGQKIVTGEKPAYRRRQEARG